MAPFRRRRPAPARPAGALTLRKLNRKINKVSNMLETKAFDVNSGYTQIATDTNNAQQLLRPPEGSGDFERDGTRISPLFLQVKMHMRQETTPATLSAGLRVVVIRSKARFTPVTDSSSDAAGVLQLGATAAAEMLSPYHWNNRNHFTVLFDRTYQLNEASSGPSGRFIFINKKLSGTTIFNDGGVVSEQGQYWLLMYTNRTAANADGPEVALASRIWYKDG